MTIEEIIEQREKAANEAIEALVRYINAITIERNYYREKTEELNQSRP